ncbi:hypothetical protein RUM44_010204 [Polyplax serrata]|uniref:Uncharacterized protein n=1 Tax=Polyplax serrata TaxID=468196 RepID=A0ABR1AUX6_POLSC
MPNPEIRLNTTGDNSDNSDSLEMDMAVYAAEWRVPDNIPACQFPWWPMGKKFSKELDTQAIRVFGYKKSAYAGSGVTVGERRLEEARGDATVVKSFDCVHVRPD